MSTLRSGHCSFPAVSGSFCPPWTKQVRSPPRSSEEPSQRLLIRSAPGLPCLEQKLNDPAARQLRKKTSQRRARRRCSPTRPIDRAAVHRSTRLRWPCGRSGCRRRWGASALKRELRKVCIEYGKKVKIANLFAMREIEGLWGRLLG